MFLWIHIYVCYSVSMNSITQTSVTMFLFFSVSLTSVTLTLYLPLFFWISTNNNPVLVRNYTCKDTQIYINNQIPLTPHSWLWNRICWLVTEVLTLINKWYQIITRAKYFLHKYFWYKYKNWFSLLVSYLWSGSFLCLYSSVPLTPDVTLFLCSSESISFSVFLFFLIRIKKNPVLIQNYT